MANDFYYSFKIEEGGATVTIGVDNSLFSMSFISENKTMPNITPIYNGYSLVYNNVFNGIDIKYILTQEKIKEYIIIKNGDFDKNIKVKLNLINCGIVFNSKDNRYDIINTDGEIIFYFSQPYVEINGKRERSLDNFTSISYNQSTCILSYKFKKEKIRSYPIIVDPTFVFNTHVRRTKVLLYDDFNPQNTMLITGKSYADSYIEEIEGKEVNSRGSVSVLSDDVVFEKNIKVIFPLSSPSQVTVTLERGKYEVYKYSALLNLETKITIDGKDYIYSAFDLELPFSSGGTFNLSCLFQGNNLSLTKDGEVIDPVYFGHYRPPNAVGGSSVIYKRRLSYIPDIDIVFPGDNSFVKGVDTSSDGIYVNNLYVQNNGSFNPYKYYLLPYSLSNGSTDYADILTNGLAYMEPNCITSNVSYQRSFFDFEESEQVPSQSGFVSNDLEEYLEEFPSCFFVGSDHIIENAFTFIALPDTQFYSKTYPNIFTSQTQWIADNAEKYQIKHVFHLGDITNGNTEVEWENASASLSILDDNQVSYSVLRGNHDSSVLYYDQYFPVSNFSDKPEWGGYCEDIGNNDCNYQLMSIKNVDYIFLNISYFGFYTGKNKTKVVSWANMILSQYSNRIAILVTHSYLKEDGTYTTEGKYMWDNIIKVNSNVRVVLCGHMHSPVDSEELKIVQNNAGYTVYQIHSDYQERANGGNGWLKVLQIFGDNLYVMTYSPYLDQWEEDADSRLGPLNLNSKTLSVTSTTFGKSGKGQLESFSNEIVAILESAVNNRKNTQEKVVFSRKYYSIDRNDFVINKINTRQHDITDISLRISIKPYFYFLLNSGKTFIDYYNEFGEGFGVEITEMSNTGDSGEHTLIEFSQSIFGQVFSDKYTHNAVEYSYANITDDLLKGTLLFAEIDGKINTFRIQHNTGTKIILKGRVREKIRRSRGFSILFFSPDQVYFSRNGSNNRITLNKKELGLNGELIYEDLLYSTSAIDGLDTMYFTNLRSGFSVDKDINLYNVEIIGGI